VPVNAGAGTRANQAITAGDPCYRTIKSILAAGTERDTPPAPAGDSGAAAFLRGANASLGATRPPVYSAWLRRYLKVTTSASQRPLAVPELVKLPVLAVIW
jgi:hypothetical protein